MRTLLITMAIAGLAGCSQAEPLTVAGQAAPAEPVDILVTSPDFAEGTTLALGNAYSGFGCVGSNRSPALTWQPVVGARSYAITMFDPDAPGDGWWHWTLANLPASTTSLPAGAGGRRGELPPGTVQGLNDFGQVGYGGPCPPAGGPHRYVFTVYALGEPTVTVDASTQGAAFKAAVEDRVIGQGTLTGLFGR